MQKGELSYQKISYDFRLAEDGSYIFETSLKIKYKVIFRSSPYVFGEGVVFAPYVYELIIELEGDEQAVKGADKRLPFTVHDIFVDFYKCNGDINICLYICDSSDGKQLVRARKFVYWFRLLNNSGIIYVGDEIKDADGTIYPIAVLMKRTNPYSFQIIDAFNNLIAIYDK